MKLIATIICATFLFQAVAQQDAAPRADEVGVIDVIGRAEMKLQPDYFSISIVVEHEDPDPEKAQKAVMEAAGEVLGFLKSRDGIGKVQTQRIQLRPQMRSHSKGDKTYHAQQSISFDLSDLDDYDAVILGLLQKGISGINSVEFRSTQEEKHEQELMKRAVMDAKEKAGVYANELGQSIGKAIYISDRIGRGPEPMAAEMYKSGVRMASSVEPGEITLSAIVNVQFELN